MLIAVFPNPVKIIGITHCINYNIEEFIFLNFTFLIVVFFQVFIDATSKASNNRSS